MLRRLARRAIDDHRWDRAVADDPTPLPYGLPRWLDAAHGRDWSGLVLGDYRAVLPLPRGRRYRLLPALLRPPFTQQLGPFGTFDEAEYTAMLATLPAR